MAVNPAKDESDMASSFACLWPSSVKLTEASSLGLASVLPTALRMLLSASSCAQVGGWKSSGVHTSDSMLRLRCRLAVLFGEYEYDEAGDAAFDGKDNGESNFECMELFTFV